MEDTTTETRQVEPDPLAGLAAEAELLEGGATPAAEALADRKAEATAAAVSTAAAEARELMGLVGAIVVPLLPERYGKCYGPAELERIGDALGAVAHKRGWSVGGVLGAWGPEIALAAACAGPILPVILADAKKRREEAASGPAGPVAPTPAPATPPDHHLAGQRVMPSLEGERVL
jgi:hypothetical protein